MYVILFVTSTFLLPGCGGGDRLTVPVEGRVTFDGGPCPAPGSIRFGPLETASGYPRRPGHAAFGTDGKFVAGAFEEDDGLVPGRYSVIIECWKDPPRDGKPGISYVPEDYPSHELVVEGTSDGIKADYDVSKPSVAANE